MSTERVQKLFSDPNFLRDYSAWLNDPVTKKMLEAASDLAEPTSLQRPDPNAALYMHGIYVGFNRMLTFLKGAEAVLSSAQETELQETYGESRVMESLYPQVSKARKRKQAPAA